MFNLPISAEQKVANTISMACEMATNSILRLEFLSDNWQTPFKDLSKSSQKYASAFALVTNAADYVSFLNTLGANDHINLLLLNAGEGKKWIEDASIYSREITESDTDIVNSTAFVTEKWTKAFPKDEPKKAEEIKGDYETPEPMQTAENNIN